MTTSQLPHGGEHFDVVIAGGGPVGLLLAAELRLHGVPVLVLEQGRPGDGEPRTLALHARTLETLDRRGLLADFVRAQESLPGLADHRRALDDGAARGHFAGLYRLGRHTGPRTEQPHGIALPHHVLRELLARRAGELGAVVRYGHEVTGLAQDEHGVTVHVRTPDGETTVRGGFLVGCDGGRSAVRKGAGIDFPGTGPSLVCRMGRGAIEVHGGGELPAGWRRTDSGWFMRMPDGRIAVSEWGVPEDLEGPATADELAGAIERVTGQRITLTDVDFVTRFTDSARQASRYRAGRVLLAGDAAHIHYPAGGQGANLGLQDAVNLGWKLAAECRGGAPAGLLDSYGAERHPVAARVLENTRAQVALMRPGPQVDALRALFLELMAMDEVNQYLSDIIHATGIRYEPAPGSHPLAGSFARDLPLTTASGPTRLAELLRRGRPLLVVFDGPGSEGSDAPAAAAGWADRVGIVRAAAEDPYAAALLVRPDGYLAWASDGPVDPGAVRAALTAWCGAEGGGAERTGTEAEEARAV
ncbi:polyketide oxidase [Streptomyces sp. NRRL F-4489]|uniref:FAD-dependent monooxygenase n=1 Tax=Streptomyces sp. NRRL F-4489 TaxID=1609095 RepID=UPI0007483710|nr:FAD-dependent monooxygenase [Streptomyces sp. NRRL F-4489]KUL38177.1 polyketide oxidase [Streptomyces sp. NRRL F-4489]